MPHVVPRFLRLAIPVLALGCVTGRVQQPNATLRAATSPAPAVHRFGTLHLASVQHLPMNYVAEDSAVKVTWAQHDTYMGVKVENKTAAAIRILWDDAAMVGRQGNSERVLPTGARYLTRDESHPPAVIPPGAYWIGGLTPVGNITFKGSDWIVAPLFTPDLGPGDIRMLLPIVIDGVQYDYEFTFALQAAPTRRGR